MERSNGGLVGTQIPKGLSKKGSSYEKTSDRNGRGGPSSINCCWFCRTSVSTRCRARGGAIVGNRGVRVSVCCLSGSFLESYMGM